MHRFTCHLVRVDVRKSRATVELSGISSLDGGILEQLDGHRVVLTVDTAPPTPRQLSEDAVRLAQQGSLEEARQRALEAVELAFKERPVDSA